MGTGMPAAGTMGRVTAPQIQPPPAAVKKPRTTDSTSVALTVALAVLTFAFAVMNFGAAFGFPSNAPVELLASLGITIDFFAAAVVLTVRSIVLARRTRALAEAQPRPGGMAFAAIILAGFAFIGWFPMGGLTFLRHAFTEPEALRYMNDVLGMFLLGIPWVLGLVFGVVAYRRGAGIPNNTLAIVAIGLSLLLVVPTLYSGIAYGLGLTD